MSSFLTLHIHPKMVADTTDNQRYIYGHGLY